MLEVKFRLIKHLIFVDFANCIKYNRVMKKIIIKLLLCLVPSSRTRKILRHKYLGQPLPYEWGEYKRRDAYGDKHVYLGQDGTDIIHNELCKDKPSLICRFGTTELGILIQFARNKERKIKFENPEHISVLSGFFPNDTYHLSRFSSEMLEIIPDIDVLGVLQYDEEYELVQKYARDIKLIGFDSINNLTMEKPWSRYLKGKKVLVIHPFAETIESQYKKREFLFANKDMLPEFELKTIKAVQGLADSKNDLPFKTWFESLDYMKEQIRNTDFDVAIAGAGAYGIFLAHYCKQLGKKGIHMGGSTQALFGIKGMRWDDYGIYNEHWVYPSAQEKPKGAEKVEGGCYW